MGIISTIKAVWNRLFRREVKEQFGAEIQMSNVMDTWISRYYKITEGNPYWKDPEDDVRSIRFAGFIDDFAAGLVTLDLGISVSDESGRGRARYLQKQADYVLAAIQDKVSEALGNVGIMFKPNGTNIDYMGPFDFTPTESDSNGNILGCVFHTQIKKGEYAYTRLEWHRFEKTAIEGEDGSRVYRITNRAYKSRSSDSIGKPCRLSEVDEWKNLLDDVLIQNVEQPLFAYFRNPMPNRIDRTSPLGVPIWNDALEELRNLDIAWGRKSGEVDDSKHMTFLSAVALEYTKARDIKLPRFIKGVDFGTDDGKPVAEHVATLLTEQRIKDINSILAMISMKCGFSQGMFVLDEKTGMMTATQVQADDQETIRTIKNIRDALQRTMTDLLYACNVMADLYTDTPSERWEDLQEKISFNFGDITYSYQEDQANWWKYRLQGDVPPWMYYVKFEGMSEEEAKAMVEEAQPKEPTFFEEE